MSHRKILFAIALAALALFFLPGPQHGRYYCDQAEAQRAHPQTGQCPNLCPVQGWSCP